MIRIGLIDDDLAHTERMKGFLHRYEKEEGCAFEITEFSNGMNFVEDYQGNLDVIFLDIEMPLLNGMEVAREIRKKDDELAIIFITHMVQYAVQGYSVNAVDFIVKPVTYFVFADKMRKALHFRHLNKQAPILLRTEDSLIKLTAAQIFYIEKEKNYLIYHTRKGDFRVRGTIRAIEETLLKEGFSCCMSGCIVNLRYVEGVNKDTVWVVEQRLPISRNRYKQFMEDFLHFLGGDYK